MVNQGEKKNRDRSNQNPTKSNKRDDSIYQYSNEGNQAQINLKLIPNLNNYDQPQGRLCNNVNQFSNQQMLRSSYPPYKQQSHLNIPFQFNLYNPLQQTQYNQMRNNNFNQQSNKEESKINTNLSMEQRTPQENIQGINCQQNNQLNLLENVNKQRQMYCNYTSNIKRDLSNSCDMNQYMKNLNFFDVKDHLELYQQQQNREGNTQKTNTLQFPQNQLSNLQFDQKSISQQGQQFLNPYQDDYKNGRYNNSQIMNKQNFPFMTISNQISEEKLGIFIIDEIGVQFIQEEVQGNIIKQRIFIDEEKTNRAIHGSKVKFILVNKNNFNKYNSNQRKAKILSVLKYPESLNSLIGFFGEFNKYSNRPEIDFNIKNKKINYQSNCSLFYFYPLENKYPIMILRLNNVEEKYPNGELFKRYFKVKFVEWPDDFTDIGPVVEIIEQLGYLYDEQSDYQAQINMLDLNMIQLPEEEKFVQKAIEIYKNLLIDQNIYTFQESIDVFTIDQIGTIAFDDGLSIEKITFSEFNKYNNKSLNQANKIFDDRIDKYQKQIGQMNILDQKFNKEPLIEIEQMLEEIQITEETYYRIGIHISDFSACIEKGTPLYEGMEKRGQSIYLNLGDEQKNFVKHMLDRKLIDQFCLKKGEIRLVKSIFFCVKKESQGAFRIEWNTFSIQNTKIRIKENYFYDEFDNLCNITNEITQLYNHDFTQMKPQNNENVDENNKSAQISSKKLVIDQEEARILLLIGGYLYKDREEKGQKVFQEENQRYLSSKTVEEFMILYNQYFSRQLMIKQHIEKCEKDLQKKIQEFKLKADKNIQRIQNDKELLEKELLRLEKGSEYNNILHNNIKCSHSDFKQLQIQDKKFDQLNQINMKNSELNLRNSNNNLEKIEQIENINPYTLKKNFLIQQIDEDKQLTQQLQSEIDQNLQQINTLQNNRIKNSYLKQVNYFENQCKEVGFNEFQYNSLQEFQQSIRILKGNNTLNPVIKKYLLFKKASILKDLEKYFSIQQKDARQIQEKNQLIEQKKNQIIQLEKNIEAQQKKVDQLIQEEDKHFNQLFKNNNCNNNELNQQNIMCKQFNTFQDQANQIESIDKKKEQNLNQIANQKVNLTSNNLEQQTYYSNLKEQIIDLDQQIEEIRRNSEVQLQDQSSIIEFEANNYYDMQDITPVSIGYVTATSPIRKFNDLIAQKFMNQFLDTKSNIQFQKEYDWLIQQKQKNNKIRNEMRKLNEKVEKLKNCRDLLYKTSEQGYPSYKEQQVLQVSRVFRQSVNYIDFYLPDEMQIVRFLTNDQPINFPPNFTIWDSIIAVKRSLPYDYEIISVATNSTNGEDIPILLTKK